jgi:hypothetical protein
VTRTANALTVVIIGISTLLMLTLPIVLFYATYGVGGAIGGGVFAALFWSIMGAQYMRVRRRRNAS